MTEKLFPVECMSHDLFSTKFAMDGHCDTLARTDYKEPPVVAYAVDSHPMDSRIRIVEGPCPSVTAKLAKLASDGPLVLIMEKQ